MYCLLENIFDHPQSAETFWIPAEGIISHLNRDSTIVMSHSVTCCCVLLGVVAQSLKPVKRLSQQFILFLLFRDRRSVVNSRELHVVSLEFTEFYGLYPSHDVLQVPEMLRPFARSLRCGVNLIKLLQV